jgi:hypothetical protein
MPDNGPDMNDPRFGGLSLEGERHKVAALLAALEAAGLADDDDIITDSIEGETNAMEAVSNLLRRIGESESMMDGLQAYIKALQDRKARVQDRTTSMRKAILGFMSEFGIKKIERPEATVSMGAGQQSVGYSPDFDARSLPPVFQKVTVEADKAKVKEALKAGEVIPGCWLTNAQPTLTVRVK